MINELVIHLGDTKTGSTSIQQALVRKVVTTPGKSIAYRTSLNHHSLASTLTKEKAHGARADRFNKLYKYFKKDDSDFGIVSSEHFQAVDPQDLKDAITTYWPELADRVRLVSYVRPHGDKILSTFSERIKIGADIQSMQNLLDAFDKTGGLNYTKRFRKWRRVFGDRFELRPFVRKNLFQGDAVADFFKFVLGNDDFSITSSVSTNTSLTISQLAMLREMHMTLRNRIGGKKMSACRVARGELGRLLADYMQANGLGQDHEKPRLPESLVAPVIERYGADAATLDADFFDGTPMTEALNAINTKTVSSEQSLSVADYFPPEVVKSTQAFSNVLGEMMVQDPVSFRKIASAARVKVKSNA